MSRLSGQTRANSQQDLTFFFFSAAAAAAVEPEEQVKLAVLLLLTKMKIGCFYKYDRQRGLAPSLSCSLPRSAKEAESLKRCGGGGAFCVFPHLRQHCGCLCRAFYFYSPDPRNISIWAFHSKILLIKQKPPPPPHPQRLQATGRLECQNAVKWPCTSSRLTVA